MSAESHTGAGGTDAATRRRAAANGADLLPAIPPSTGRARSQFPAIRDLALLSDGETTALIAPTGNVEWMCVPRPDAPSVFGTLLDRGAGRFRVGPAGVAVPASQRYLLASMVVETSWMTGDGLLLVRDALLLRPWGDERRTPDQQRPPGDVRAEHVLMRTLTCLHGSVEVTVDCEPMFDYGRTTAAWEYRGPGYHTAEATAPDGELTLRLQTDLRLGFEGGRAGARTTLHESERAFVALCWGDAEPPVDADDAFHRVERTWDRWRRWVSTGDFPDHPWRAHLQRSALTLKSLTYAPTGAVLAACTTSLPRALGASRNWDQRYAFVRDAASALRAFYQLGFAWEADDFLAFLGQVTAGGERLHSLYRVGGEDAPEEVELGHLSGYRGSRPVRVGNAAARYAQHDASGLLLDAAAVHARARRRLATATWKMAESELEAVLERWREPDQGIWALRGEPRHYTTSKLMCWLAAVRGARLAELRGRPERAGEWRDAAAEIAADILERGVGEAGRFRDHYDSDELDASLLLIPLTGFLAGDDERVQRTVRAIGEELTVNGIVLRRRPRPGEPVSGEAFAVCSWWFVAALVAIGDTRSARGLAERLLAYASALGMYGEHLDPHSGRQLGNFPHALTHLAVIDSLVRLIRAETAAPEREDPV